MPAKKKPTRRKTVTRKDSWTSALSGVGTQKDPRQYAYFASTSTNWRENIDLWRGDDLAGRIVELPIDEMMRKKWKLCIEGDDGPDIAKRVVAFLEERHINERLWQAACLERAVGGAGIVIGTNDLRSMEEPLDLKRVSSLEWLETFEPRELQVKRWQNDPTQPGFGRPEVYMLMPQSKGGSKVTSVAVHSSRIGLFPGIVVSRMQITSQAGWGDAVLTRCRDTLRDFQTAWAAVGLLIHGFAQPVWKIKGLSEIIALDHDKELKARIDMMAMAMSTVRAIVIDSEAESWERQPTPVTGLSDLMVQLATRLAASAGIPVTKLMGISPAGMNATGESDTRNWYDTVHSMAERKLTPPLTQIIRVAFAALDIEEPEDWYIEYPPLWQPTEGEQAQARLTQMQVDTGYINAQVYSSNEVREQRFGGRQYSFDTHIEGELEEPPSPQEATADPEYQQMVEEAQPPPPDDEKLDERPTRRVPVTAHERVVRSKS